MTRTRIIEAFAKANGVKPALFSANSAGACPNCNGPASSTPTCPLHPSPASTYVGT